MLFRVAIFFAIVSSENIATLHSKKFRKYDDSTIATWSVTTPAQFLLWYNFFKRYNIFFKTSNLTMDFVDLTAFFLSVIFCDIERVKVLFNCSAFFVRTLYRQYIFKKIDSFGRFCNLIHRLWEYRKKIPNDYFNPSVIYEYSAA